jgi:glyoxylase I family protein
MPIGNKNSVIKGCGTHHIAIQTRDWDASLHLYQDVLGMEIVARFGPPEQKIFLLDTGDGSHIELFEPKTDTPAIDAPAANDPVIHFALATTDARAALEHVREAGYEITVEPKDLTLDQLDVTIAFFKGPNGEVIEFFETH